MYSKQKENCIDTYKMSSYSASKTVTFTKSKSGKQKLAITSTFKRSSKSGKSHYESLRDGREKATDDIFEQDVQNFAKETNNTSEPNPVNFTHMHSAGNVARCMSSMRRVAASLHGGKTFSLATSQLERQRVDEELRAKFKNLRNVQQETEKRAKEAKACLEMATAAAAAANAAAAAAATAATAAAANDEDELCDNIFGSISGDSDDDDA